MIDTPIRKKAKNYPKDFTPPPGYLTSTRNLNTPQTELNVPAAQHSIKHLAQINMDSFNKSTQLTARTFYDTKHLTITINPQEPVIFAATAQNEQKPLANLHIGKKKPYINPELLARPRIEEKEDQDLIDGEQQENMEQSTPGTIRKNVCLQKPLQEEQPNNLVFSSRPGDAARKVESSQNIFYSSLKNHSPNFTVLKQKRFATYLKPASMEQDDRFRLHKKESSFHVSQSHLRTQREKERCEEKQKSMQFGSLYEQKELNKLKAHINQIVYDKKKQKQRIGNTHQTQADFDKQSNAVWKFRPRSNFIPKTHPRNHHHFNLETAEDQQAFENKTRSYHQNDLKLNPKPDRKVTISYKKTSLSILKQIYSSIKHAQNIEIEVSIPTILMNINLGKNTEKHQLYSQSAVLFESLGIPAENLTVKRYSNCIMMLSKNICILWHYDGKVYLGSWQTKYLDEGFKHGLGLEWVPHKHVYYGEFCEGKKQGLGIMKTQDEVFFGEWSRGKSTDNGYLIGRHGEISTCQIEKRSNKIRESQEFQTDPFL